MSAVPPLLSEAPLPRLRIEYETAPLEALLARGDTLAVLGFGNAAPSSDDPRVLRVPLQPHGAAPLEVWRAGGGVRCGREDELRWAEDGALHFGALEFREGDAGLEAASAQAYARLTAFVRARGYPHLLRTWNYLDAITTGVGDEERYRRFCLGRAAGLGAFDATTLPAATAIGRIDGERTLQVYWLAARVPGMPLENPRQVSAYRYPREYGPQPPSFARAMLPPSSHMPLLLSGTASVVGHESRHHDSLAAQVGETFANFDALIGAARARRPELSAQFGPQSRLKVYVRDAAALPEVAALLDAKLGPSVPRVLLHAAVCRRELQVEIDGVHA
jgi:chorismate lyase/3-hydroxybenzoate synthase